MVIDGLKSAMMGIYYEALRGYDSGSVRREDLNHAFGAMSWYVRDITIRLVGHAWSAMQVAFVVMFVSLLLSIFLLSFHWRLGL